MSDEPVILGGRYRLEEVIGRGGMAEVWRARDQRLDRLVAIKRLRVDLATDSTFQARFAREAQSAAGLNHPNIVSVYDTGEKVDPASGVTVPYIVMELVEGHTLREILRQGTKLTPEKAFEYTIGVLDALGYSHKHAIVHRDIKPANVMITPTGQVKVMDFGIARAVSDTSATMTQTAAVIGTAQYLSPEQARGEQVDARSDIYSAGCLLYELLTGRPPFLGDSPVSVAYQHVREMPIPPSQLDAELTPQMDAITMTALAKSTEDRYQSAKAMRDDCWRLLNGQEVTARIPAVVSVNEPIAMTAATRALPVEDYHEYQYATEESYAVAEAAGGQPPRQRRISPATVVIIGLLILLLGALGVFAWRLLAPNAADNNVQVPEVIGFQEEAAVEQLTLAQLDPKIERESGPAAGKGTVIRQNPTGGTTALVGSTVTITINDGPPTSTIPQGLVGKQQEEAIALLREAGFTKIEPLPAPADLDAQDAKKGQVVRVSPAEGTEVSTDQQVTLFVASGRATLPADLVGRSEADAREVLRQAGFTNVSSEYLRPGLEPVTYVRGQVVSIRPDVGTPVALDTAIVLLLASGESQMPNLIGMSRSDALAELQNNRGFTKVDVIEQETTDPSRVEHVVAQSVAFNEVRPRDYAITITVGKLTESAPATLGPTAGGTSTAGG